MKHIGTILAFEYMGYLKNKAFRVTTIVLLVLILLASFFPQIKSAVQGVTGEAEKGAALLILNEGSAGQGDSGQGSAGAGDADSPSAGLDIGSLVNTDVLDTMLPDYRWELGSPSDDPKASVETDGYDIALAYDGGQSYMLYGPGHNLNLYGMIGVLNEFFTNVGREAAMQSLSPDARVSAEQVLGTVITGELVSVGGGGDAGSSFWLSYILLYLLFMVMIMYGQFVISSVVNEKSTKAMEILITSAKPIHLMFGKVVGVGCAALTQLLMIILTTALGLFLNFGSWKEQLPDVASGIATANISLPIIIFFILFFVCGYLLYAFIYAGLGSTVSKIEDAGAVTTLPQFFVIAAFIVSILGMANLDAAYVKILSYVPFFSPYIMFARMSMGEAGYLQGVIAVLILVPTIVLFAWIAAKIYRIGVMMYGKPMKLKDIIKVLIRK